MAISTRTTGAQRKLGLAEHRQDPPSNGVEAGGEGAVREEVESELRHEERVSLCRKNEKFLTL